MNHFKLLKIPKNEFVIDGVIFVNSLDKDLSHVPSTMSVDHNQPVHITNTKNFYMILLIYELQNLCFLSYNKWI